MFVRTENGIYEVISLKKEKFGKYYCYRVDRKNINKYSLVAETSILKQADTIEELCDCFYWDCKDGFNIHNFMNYSIAKDTWDEYVSDCLIDEEKIESNMYGCIKTSKGLIYVAKMNEKGELKLLCQN